MTEAFMMEVLEFLRTMGGAITEASRGVINFLNSTDIIPGYTQPFWMFITGLFITLIVPWTIVKWFNPL